MASQEDRNDDDDEHLTLRVAPPPRSLASLTELQLELKKNQLKEIQLEEKIKKLSLENAVLSSKDNGKGRKKRKEHSELPEGIASDSDLITKLGKKYCIFVVPWLSPSVFKRSNPTDIDITGTARYLNTQTREDAIVAELYHFIPEQYHPSLGRLGKFADLFRGGMSAMRSTALYTIKPHCTTIFESLDANLFKTGLNKKDNDELKKLIGWDKKKEKFAYWAPILFPDANSKNDLRYAFRNKSLALILRVILFGASSLSTIRRSTPKTNGQIWGVTSVNDSAIAFAAILARFILSGDQEFVEIGNNTNIDYLGDFWAYRQFLASVADAPHEALINWFNKRVFVEKTGSALTSARDSDDNDKIHDDDLAAFNEGVSDEDEEGEGEGVSDGSGTGDSNENVGGDEDDYDENALVASSTAATRHSSPAILGNPFSRHASPRLSEPHILPPVIDEEIQSGTINEEEGGQVTEQQKNPKKKTKKAPSAPSASEDPETTGKSKRSTRTANKETAQKRTQKKKASSVVRSEEEDEEE